MGPSLRRRLGAWTIGGAVALGTALGAAPAPVLAYSSTQLGLINQDRLANGGLPALAWSTCLSAIAIQNAQRIAAQGSLSHTNGAQLDLQCGIGSTQGGENIAYLSGGIDDQAVNTLFMNSAPHRANILGPYQFAATAWAVAPNGYAYIAEEFLGASSAVVPSGFKPLEPSRILDTRTGAGGVPVAPLPSGGSLTVQVAGRGGVPAGGVASVVLNVTVTDTSAPGYLIVYPAGDPRPLASNLNWTAGQTVPNLVAVRLGGTGQVTLFNGNGSADVVIDVAGYVPVTTATAGPDGLYTPVVPARILDTRTGNGAPLTPLGPAQTLTLQVSGRGGVPAAGAEAVALNVTVTNPTAAGYLTVFPASTGLPLASNLNFTPGETVPNRVVVKLGPTGAISIFNGTGSTDVVVDVNGWFSDGVSALRGGQFWGVTPVRILDTRTGTGGFRGPVGAGAAIALQVASLGGVPGMTDQLPPTAVVLNVTVTDTSSGGYLTVYPSGVGVPLASDLNWSPGKTVPNLVVVALGSDGKVGLFNGMGSTDVVVDVVGWYD